jgi:hypothetical protein
MSQATDGAPTRSIAGGRRRTSERRPLKRVAKQKSIGHTKRKNIDGVAVKRPSTTVNVS